MDLMLLQVLDGDADPPELVVKSRASRYVWAATGRCTASMH
jgi:hypothetical protein